MFAILAHIRPLDLKTNTRVDIRVASTADAAAQGLGGFVWESAMTRRPRASIELFAIDLAAGTRTPSADFEISLTGIQEVDASSLSWKGAPVTIYRADDLRWPAVVEFDGIVTDPKRDLATEKLTLNCQVSAAALDKPLLTKEFNDIVGMVFDADKRTVLVPAGFGTCYNVEPIMFDTVRNILMVDGYGNLLGIDWVGEGLSSLGPPINDYANYAQLAAAVDAGLVPPGRWATALADGIFALGAPPTGTITCHVRLGFGMTGALMRRAIVNHAGVSADQVEDASFTALDAAVPYPIHYWTADQRQVKELVEALAAACNASPIVTLQNRVAVLRPFGGQSIGDFGRLGLSEPPINDWKTNDAVTPYWKIAARAARPVRVMTLDEINYTDVLVDRGVYDPNETYRAGNVVWLRNKSQWLYINDVATKGNAPPSDAADPGDATSDAYWQLMAPAPGAEDIVFLGGETVEALKPAEAGADVTGNHTANDTANINGVPAQVLISRIDTIDSNLDGVAGQVSEQAAILGTVQGQLQAYWTVQSIAGDGTAFVTVEATATPGQPAVSSVIIGADEFGVFNKVDGTYYKTLSVTAGLVRVYGKLELENAVSTVNIGQNNVTKSMRWSASYSGVSSDLVIPSGSTWGGFGQSSNKAEIVVEVDVDGAEVTIHWNINAERTGSKDDRVSYRLRRTDGSGAIAYVGDVLPAGMGDSPTTVNWLWDDTGLPAGTYTYAMEAMVVAGGGKFYNAKMIAEAGYR